MQHRNRWLIIVFLIIAALPLTACAQKSAAASNPKPAVVEPIEGSEFKRVVVTEKAAQRLDIQTAQVSQEQVKGTRRLAVPYASVIYGLHGETWVYTNPESLAFVREPITVDYIDGDTAFLLAGPPIGTAVVTVGGAELYGTETGVSK
jgi:hypothetical protein